MNYRHLRWTTQQENLADRKRDGTLLRGEAHPQSKITEHDVRRIRALSGVVSQDRMALMFGVSAGQIHRIASRQNWGHVT